MPANVIGALLAGAMRTSWRCDFNFDTEVYSVVRELFALGCQVDPTAV